MLNHLKDTYGQVTPWMWNPMVTFSWQNGIPTIPSRNFRYCYASVDASVDAKYLLALC